MRAHADHGRRGRRGRCRARTPRGGRRLLLAGGLSLLVAAPPATIALAQSFKPKTVVVRDGEDAVDGALDLTRVSLGRASDGRLRAALSMADEWQANDLVAASGPPGSICLRVWTMSDPPDTPPDFLVCVTSDGKKLRGSVLRERANALPERVGEASVTRPSDLTVSVRFSQTSIGRPSSLEFAGETTRAGCPRFSCIDSAPNAPEVARLRLRKPASTNRPAAAA